MREHHLPILTIEKPDDLQTGGRVLCKTAQPANRNAPTVSAVVAVRCAGVAAARRLRAEDRLGPSLAMRGTDTALQGLA